MNIEEVEINVIYLDEDWYMIVEVVEMDAINFEYD
jgi:hypothetical protein